ncbi:MULTISPECIES: DUF5335 family protein [unclassified Phenylobacterium]|jgi:hypothetical protein|uniref:DUF5335 family protein n=1 Tax=unclassified Phenylobacterium TaxID=2640670 RepID=UPI00083A1EA5|nr:MULTISPECIES: DUF5335 family protein [unclassified Phenylobacterium]
MAMVEKVKWQAAADLLSGQIRGQAARLEVVAAALGDQVEAEWAPFHGITYDPKGDLFEIQFEGVDHLVRHPRQFAIQERAGRAHSLAVVDNNGTKHIMQLREPIALPPTPT